MQPASSTEEALIYCKKSECLEKAVGSKALEKAFKVSIPAEVYEQLDKELRDIEE